jgi:hypothetical protein
MNLHGFVSIVIVLTVLTGSAQPQTSASDNAALRYWAAFAQMQDSPITDAEAKSISAILDGTAPYDDSRYKDLVQKNAPALQIMARGTKLPDCDWGLDYGMGPDTPQEYARKALVLGRLNVLYSLHLLSAGEKDKAGSTLAAGVRFSHDVANSGSLFATLVAKSLLVAHFTAIEVGLSMGGISRIERSGLQKAVAELGPDGLDWRSAMQRELGGISEQLEPQAASALARIAPAYTSALRDPATLPDLQKMIANAPWQWANLIPNPERVLQAKQGLSDKVREMRSRLQ